MLWNLFGGLCKGFLTMVSSGLWSVYTSVSRPNVYWWKCSKEKRFRVRESSTGVRERLPFLHQCCAKASARGSTLGGKFHSWIIMRQQRCNCDKFLQLAHPSLLLISQLPMAVSRHIGPMMLERPGSQPTYWPHDVGAFRETADILAPWCWSVQGDSRHIGPMMLERSGRQPTYWPHDVGAFRETADILAPWCWSVQGDSRHIGPMMLERPRRPLAR